MEKSTRFLKAVRVTVSDVDNIENMVNKTIACICNCGGKVIAITSQTFGLSPMYLLYNIVYENDREITPKEFKKGENE